MAKINPVQTNFTAGELSGRLSGRIDVDRYNNGAERIENYIPLVEGGLRRRYGLRQVAPAKNAVATRLIRYVYSRAEKYVLEFGAGYVRVFSLSGQVTSGGAPLEVATPYGAADLAQLEYVQSTDSLVIAHPGYPLKRLYRVSPSQWVMGDLPLDPAPFAEIGDRPAATATLSATSGDITITLSTDGFSSADVNRNVVAGAGIATITDVTSASAANAKTIADFAALQFGANEWKLAGSPQVPVCALATNPPGATTDLYAMGASIAISSMSLTDTTLTVQTVDPHGLVVGDFINFSFFESSGIDGNYHVATAEASVFTVDYTGTLLASAAFGFVYKFGGGSAFSAADVGKYVRLNDGLLKISAFVGASQVKAQIVKAPTGSTTAEAAGWSLESECWNPLDGYPAAVATFQQRLIAAGTTSFPHGMWGSSTGTTTDFTIATDADDAFLFSASAEEVSQIRHLMTAASMFAFSSSAEFAISVGNSNTIGPTDAPNVQTDSAYGSSDVRPLRVGSEIVFTQRAGRKVRAIRYDYASNSFIPRDLTALAEQISESGIVDCAYQQESTPCIWFVRADGTLVLCTYDAQQNVTGWARQPTDGKVVSVACIPGDANDVDDIVFVAVDRTINGATTRFIERLDSTLQMDCAITGSSASPAKVWNGFDTLNGATVDVKADGVYQGQFTVADGSITLSRVASAIEVGLHYDSTVKLLPPAINGVTGTNIGSAQSTDRVIIRVRDTIGGTINGDEVPWREFGEGILNAPPQPFTGDKDVTQIGWSEDASLTIQQTQPYAFELLAVVRSYTTNQG